MVSLAWAAVLLCADAAFSQQMAAMDQGTASAFGAALAGELAKVDGLQLQIEYDPMQASGLLEGTSGIILVPAKGLKEEGFAEAGNAEAGAPLGYLFMTPRFNPLAGDNPAAEGELREIKYGSGDGRATALVLSAKHVAGDEWKLYVFGSGQAPLIEAPVFPADESKPGPLSMRVEDVQDQLATLVVTVFGRYEAPLTISYKK